MTQFEGRGLGGPTLQDAEALLRSLVGVAAVRLITGTDGALHEVVVVPESEAIGRQVVRNVASALIARFGLDLHPDTITIAVPAADTVDHRTGNHDAPALIANGRQGSDGSVSARARGLAPATPARPGPVARNGDANGTVSGRIARNGANGDATRETAQAGSGQADPGRVADTGASETPARNSARVSAPLRPRLELAELVRSGSNCRCRVIVAAGAERFTGVGDGEDGRIADIELAGRVAVDALRAARTPRDPIQFEGAVLVDIAGRAHVAVSLSVWTGSDFDTIAGAAPVHGSPAESAARAVIDSIVAHVTA